MWKKILVGVLTTIMLGGTVLPAMAAGTLTMSGSTSVQPLAEDLAREYNLKHHSDQITFSITGGGSGVGIADVAAGRVDIGNASRDLKASEVAQGLVATVIARDAIAVVVHPDNPVQSLTSTQVAAIFKGQITNWAQVGGNYATIVVNSRTSPSGTLDFFKEHFVISAVVAANEWESNGDLRDAVAADENAIGFLSMGYLDSTVKAPNLDGQVVSLAAAKAGQYKVIRNFNMVTLGQPTGNAQTFINWVLSSEGQAIVTQDYLSPQASKAAAAKDQVRPVRQQRKLR